MSNDAQQTSMLDVREEVSPAVAKGGILGGMVSMLLHWTVAGKTSAWLASAMVHAAAVLVLSLFVYRHHGTGPPNWLDASLAEASIADVLDDEPDWENEMLVTSATSPSSSAASASALTVGSPSSTSVVRVEPPTLETRSGIGEPQAVASPTTETIAQPLMSHGGGLQGRMVGNRHELAMQGGGSPASEAAVERGLAWLAAHQWEDGGWRFDLGATPQCQGECRHSGKYSTTTAPTGLALLCFLGAGYTQHEGPYQEVVAKGLYYLTEKMILTSFGGDLRDLASGKDSMYSHAIATLALTEAYAMTRDENLAGPAQEAINFIVNAQHEKGGWRYEPEAPGDTTVTGWQIAALKSGLLGRLKIPYEVWHKASAFLDGVQFDRGSQYGYQTPTKKTTSITAIGLFSRMMLGWPRDHRPLLRGMAIVGKENPRKNHMYFNYYASIILHHLGGKDWERWNVRMRKYLVETQGNGGHESGSWYFAERHSTQGGRLYSTAMAIMTLEVYYRYMPLYQSDFVDRTP